jgi:hypothetical protein
MTSELQTLKSALQALNTNAFEKLAAAMISELLDVPVSVAKAGFQFGGDAGSAGKGGRRFRIEAKRYRDQTALSDRELLGEIDDAITGDRALEAWFLVATREVSEQLEQSLLRKSEQVGVPVLVVDWKQDGFPVLASLCSVSTKLIEKYCGLDAAEAAARLKDEAKATADRLKKEMESWSLGFFSLRKQSEEQLQRIWSDKSFSVARFGQDVAGGIRDTTIRRLESFHELDSWWKSPGQSITPAIVCGIEGYGKTWAAIEWAVNSDATLPIILPLPASHFLRLQSPTLHSTLSVIAEALFELTNVRDIEHWRRRLRFLLERPEQEGPVIVLFIDGLNQEPTVGWRRIFQILQDETLAGRVRVIATTRKHHFEERLRRLSGLVVSPKRIDVGPFSDEEFDRRLAHDGLTRSDLGDELVRLAKTPRLYDLVIKLRENLDNSSEVTLHRMLWEFGRDLWSTHTNRKFSEDDWRSTLGEIAENLRNGFDVYNLKQISHLASRADLGESETYQRLSEIVDGTFFIELPSGKYKLSEAAVAHALGAAMLTQLQDVSLGTSAEVEEVLAEWLDPISGLDQRADILRAAVNIMLGQTLSVDDLIPSEIVAAWLSTQNLGSEHRRELKGIARAIASPLLSTLERDPYGSFRTARILALDALRDVPKDDESFHRILIDRTTDWLTTISRGVDPPGRRHEESEKRRSQDLQKRIGCDADGPIRILGVDFNLVERNHNPASGDIPELLEGFPMAPALQLLERVAIANAVKRQSDIWDPLKWVLLLNEVDFAGTAESLKVLAKDIRQRGLESGIHPELKDRVAALLYWLSCDETMEAEAVDLNPQLDQLFNYEQDYLPNPGISFYRLERQHLDLVLKDKGIPLFRRMDRAKHFWGVPKLTLPSEFVTELAGAAEKFEVSEINVGRSRSKHDFDFEQLIVPLAHGSPEALARLVRRAFSRKERLDPERRFGTAVHCCEHFLLVNPDMADALAGQRSFKEEVNSDEKSYITEQMMLFEIAQLSGPERIRKLIEADLSSFTYDPGHVLKPLSAEELDGLITWASAQGTKATQDLITLLSIVEAEFSRQAWQWLIAYADDTEFERRGVAFKVLSRKDKSEFGNHLLNEEWSWTTAGDVWVNHYGSLALIEASVNLPFEQSISSITPSLIPHALARRGHKSSDASLALDVLDSLILGTDVEVVQPIGEISVHTDWRGDDPASFSVKPPPLYGDGFSDRMREMGNREEAEKHRANVVEDARARIDEARKKGARLYNHSFDDEHLHIFVSQHRVNVDRWIEGFQTQTTTFSRRVHRAEGFFMALCEALLETDPSVGTALWKSLKDVVHTRFVGYAGLNEFWHMLFKHSHAPEAQQLLDELYELPRSKTDEQLFELALAAQLNDCRDWLETKISADLGSSETWRRQRGQAVAGYLANNDLEKVQTGVDKIASNLSISRLQKKQQWQHREAASRFWWDAYWGAENAEDAYAAWVLFMHTVDRRAHCWLADRIANVDEENDLNRLKLAHFRLNFDEMKRAMKKQEKDTERHFIGRRIAENIMPWRTILEHQEFD